MRYFVKKERDYKGLRNNLERDLRALLTLHDNTIIEGDEQLADYLTLVTRQIEKLHEDNKRCNKIHTSIQSGFGTDTYLKAYYMGSAGSLVIYPVKKKAEILKDGRGMRLRLQEVGS